MILLQHVETCLKLFQNRFTGLLQLRNCRNNLEISLELLQRLKKFYISFRCGYM